MTPKKDQVEALKRVKKWFKKKEGDRSDFMVLSGYAGTGKSTLLGWLREELSLGYLDVIFSSFTGKATNVLVQGGLRAMTLHRLLYKTRFNKKTGTYFSTLKPDGLAESLIVVDEASMLSRKLFDDLKRIDGKFKVLFVGDDAQLPPIDSSFNIMDKPDFRLTRVLRQAALNPIIRLATKIRNGEPWKIEKVINDGLGYMPVTEEVLKESTSRLFENDVFLCSTNKDRVFINRHIREDIHSGKSKKKVGILSKDDRLIVLDNCKEQDLFNGQLFTVSKFKKINKHKTIVYGAEVGVEDDERSIIIHPHSFLSEKASNRFELSKKYKLEFKAMGVSCDYAYCLTVHKSQGSEFERVFLQLTDRDKRIWGDLYYRWLYTAVTRASKNLYFV